MQADAQGRCNRNDLARLPELSADRLAKGRGFTYVTTPEPSVRRSVSAGSSLAALQPRLFAPVVLYGTDPAGSLLIGYDNQRLCGWIEPGALLFDRGADLRRYALGPAAVAVEAGPDGSNHPGNALGLKVVLKGLGETRSGRNVPILKAAGASLGTSSIEVLGHFQVYDVLAWKQAADPDAGGRERIFYLIGHQGDPADGGKLEGWIHQDFAYVWTSRIAAAWAGTGEAKGYVDQGRIGVGPPGIAEPPGARPDEPGRGPGQRFPILDQSPSSTELSHRALQMLRFLQRPQARLGQAAVPVQRLPWTSEVSRRLDLMLEHYLVATPRGTFYFKPHAGDGRPLFHLFLALEDTPLRRLARIAADLCHEIDRPDGTTVLRRAIESSLDVVINNQRDSIADLMAKRLSVPAYLLDLLLLRPWVDMEDDIRHAAGTQRLDAVKRGFCKSATQLAWVSSGQRLAPKGRGMAWDAARRTWKPVDERDLEPYPWKHSGGTSVPLNYVPVEFLPREDPT